MSRIVSLGRALLQLDGLEKVHTRFLNYVFLEWCQEVPIWLRLGRCANNQNGNLRWYLPWRGGVSRGSRVPHTYSEIWFFWKPFRIIPWLLKRVLHLVWVSYYVYIVVEMTLNMAKLLGPSVTSISNHLKFPFWLFAYFPFIWALPF